MTKRRSPPVATPAGALTPGRPVSEVVPTPVPAPAPAPEPAPALGAVYIFTNPDFEEKSLYKIGYVKSTKSLEKRLRQFTCGNPSGKFVHVWKDIPDAYQVEQDMHLIYKRSGKHHTKEWFLLENINSVIDEMTLRINGGKIQRPQLGNYENECDAILYTASKGLDKCLDLAVDAIRKGESLNQERFSMLKIPKKDDEYKRFVSEFPQSNPELKKFLLGRCCSKEVAEIYKHQMLFQNKKMTGLTYVNELLSFATFGLK